ncbi:MAG: hypothetical protein ACOYEV_17320, partial [Candidatus Nanopelagicales bacterium]
MSESVEFAGLATVVSHEAGTITIAPVAGGAGGSPLAVPAVEFDPIPNVGQVLNLEVVHDGTDWLVEYQPAGVAQKKQLKRTRGGYEIKGRPVITLPFPPQVTDQRTQDVAAGFAYWMFTEPISGLPGHFQDLPGDLQAKRAEQEEKA